MTDADEPPRGDSEKTEKDGKPNSKADLAKRQSDLLDEALLETFPASDPVSVARVK